MLMAGTVALGLCFGAGPESAPVSAARAPSGHLSKGLRRREEMPRGSGTGLMGAGSVLVGLGALWSTPWLVLALTRSSWFEGAARIAAPGLIVSGIGFPFLIAGSLRQDTWENWAKHNKLHPPPTGAGMTSAGTLMLISSGALLAFGGKMRTGCGGGDGFFCGTGLLILGASGAVGGGALLVTGIDRARQFERWRRGSVAAFVSPSIGGGVLTVSGRF